MKSILSALFSLVLVGCATYQPVPPGYTGTVATVSDSEFAEGRAKAQLFALIEVDGNGIANSFSASRSASYGQGFSLTTQFVSRQVPAKPMKVRLRASHITGAPIHALFSQATGNFFSVEGVVDFSPLPGGKYIVKGELKKDGSSVWIEDESTRQAVTEKVFKK